MGYTLGNLLGQPILNFSGREEEVTVVTSGSVRIETDLFKLSSLRD